MKLNTLLLLALFIGTFGLAQTDQEIGEDPSLAKKAEEKAKNRPKTIDVTDNIFMLKGMGGNIAVHHGIDGIFMIDTQFENISESISEEIARKTDRPLQFVLNTHMHGDHTGGNKNFKRMGAAILAHKNVRDKMIRKMYSTAMVGIDKRIEDEAKAINNNPDNKGKAAAFEKEKERIKEQVAEQVDIDYEQLPALSFENEMLFHYNDEDIRLIHLPRAHTNGDVIAYFQKSNVMHTGDAFVNGKYPYIDTKNGGSYKGYQAGLTKIMNLVRNKKGVKIIPGHGVLAKQLDVQEMQTMMKLYYDRVSFHYAQNKTEDEVAQMRDFSKFYDDQGYGDGFITTEKFLRSVYKAVEANEGSKKRASDKRAERLKEEKEKIRLKEREGKGGM